MGRWEPGASDRLRAAAIELMSERGFDAVTVADIASAAGVTSRTFFRHYADKAEVLFEGSATFVERLVDTLGRDLAEQSSATDPDPLHAVAAALDEAAALIGGDRAWSTTRQALIVANPELHERELHKLARLAQTWTAALTARGLTRVDAALTAELGVVVLRVGIESWIAGPPDVDLATALRSTLDRLARIAGDVPATVARVT